MSEEEKPIAYDTQGRPLYLHPPQVTATPIQKGVPGDDMQVVQVTRSTDPVAVAVSPEMQKLHEQSRKQYPDLNLSDGEYVILQLKRHPIGAISIWAFTITLVLLIIIGWFILLAHPGTERSFISSSAVVFVSVVALGLLLLTIIISWIAITVYRGNRFFLTNESVIQKIQTTLLAKKEQTINLENINDASFDQKGLLQTVFDFGTVKLSTHDDGDIYNFTYVSRPKHQIAIINNVVEAVKYGRPIDEALDNLSQN